MGLIYEAIDTRLGFRVALKQLHPHVASRPGAAERFLREGKAAARIRHPHVVQVLTLGAGEQGPYLAMELLEGSDLGQMLREHRRLPVEAALELLLPVIAAVAAAHLAGVVHRDLKPSNVFISRGPGGFLKPKVLDFGVSKVLADDDTGPVTATDSVLGTFEYMPPEQARTARNASYASDQYSLAVILYQCVTGELPFSGGGLHDLLQAMMTAPVLAPSQRAPDVPRALDEVLLRAMSRSPRDRFPSVRAFGGALLPLAFERDRLVWSGELRCETDEAARPSSPPSGPPSRGGPEAATPPTMPPTARDTRASARQKRTTRRALAGIAGFTVVAASIAAWTGRHHRLSVERVSEAGNLVGPSIVNASGPVQVALVPPTPVPASSGSLAPAVQPFVSVSKADSPGPHPREKPRVPAALSASGSTAPSALTSPTAMGNNGAPILP
jgi:serine/threonine-protein kinase